MPQGRRPRVEDEERHEAIRRRGMSEDKAVPITDTPAKAAAQEGGRTSPFDEWAKDDLYEKAKQVGIEGRSTMTKRQLIEALRDGR